MSFEPARYELCEDEGCPQHGIVHYCRNPNVRIEYDQIDCQVKRITEKAVLVYQEDYDEEAWIPRTLLSTRSDEKLTVGETQSLSIQKFKINELGW